MDSISPTLDDHGRDFEPRDLVGQLVAQRYSIRGLIAWSQMSLIYEALDERFARNVALKVILMPRTAMPTPERELIRRFRHESAGLAQLDHENIVTVFDTGVDTETLPHQDIYYIAMEWMEGMTLEERLNALEADGGSMDWKDILQVVQDVSSALDYAHEHELRFVHRDVTPSNIMLAGDHANLFDFGLLKTLGTPSSSTKRRVFANFTQLTQDGVVLGTPAYWAPEQIKGAEDIDKRADIYALGGVLYRMLTGHLPYEAEDSFGMSVQHLNEPPPKPSSINSALAEFDPIVARAMAKEPDDRYSSAGALANDLRDALTITPDPVLGRRLASARRMARAVSRVLWGSVGICVLVLLVFAMGTKYWNWFRNLPPGWDSSNQKVSMVEIRENIYQATVSAKHTTYVILKEGARSENPYISMGGELLFSPPETAYGIVFQYLDSESYYVFATTGLGQTAIWQRKKGQWFVWQDSEQKWLGIVEADQAWAERKYVHTDRPNRLDVTIQDGKAIGEINNQPEFEIVLDTVQPGDVGVFFSTSKDAQDPKAVIDFDFMVRR